MSSCKRRQRPWWWWAMVKRGWPKEDVQEDFRIHRLLRFLFYPGFFFLNHPSPTTEPKITTSSRERKPSVWPCSVMSVESRWFRKRWEVWTTHFVAKGRTGRVTGHDICYYFNVVATLCFIPRTVGTWDSGLPRRTTRGAPPTPDHDGMMSSDDVIRWNEAIYCNCP